MRIQELECLVGIERATIRFYEKEGLISPVRSENGYRDYSDDDAAELRRVKLLRELGVSLDTIRNLQAGSEDFSEVMRRQSQILQGRRDQMERARIVCDRISADNTTYLGLDIDRYQNLLNAPLLTPPQQGSGGTVFRERDHREPHPWRRFFARVLDHELVYVVLHFILVVVLRWRAAGDWFSILVAYAAWFLMVPLEAAWLHYLGTTPGKWIFGIRVEAIEGGKLTYGEALERAWGANYTGMALNIPGLRLWCLYKGYKGHTENWDNEWDEYSEVSFRDVNWKNWVLLVAACAAAVGISVVSVRDAQLPQFRSNRLTTAQFASNFNYYDQLLADDTCQFMYRDGTLEEVGYTQTMTIPDYGTVEYDPWAQFEYELDGYTIKAIHFNHTWYEYGTGMDFYSMLDSGASDSLTYWMPTYCRVAMLTAIASQEDASSQDVAAWFEQLNADARRSATDGVTAAYGTVTCTWDLDLELLKEYPEGSSSPDLYKVTLDLEITFE